MKFWVGVTDNRWFSFLAETRPDEANFWQPSGTPPFTIAPIGLPFLFKLKSPFNHIAGGGFFVTTSKLPLSLAWEVFGPKNGCKSMQDLQNLIEPLITKRVWDYEIGCTVLANPFFLERSLWLENPPGWSPNIVRGKMYDTGTSVGSELWSQLQTRTEFQ